MRILSLALLLLLALPAVVFAQSEYVPLLPSLPGIKEFTSTTSLPSLLSNIYKICIGVAATLAVLQIIFAGVQYMGGDSITEKKDARERIWLAVVGLILVLSPTIVFSVINPDILKLDITGSLSKIRVTTEATGNGPTVPNSDGGTTNTGGANGTGGYTIIPSTGTFYSVYSEKTAAGCYTVHDFANPTQAACNSKQTALEQSLSGKEVIYHYKCNQGFGQQVTVNPGTICN